MHDSRASDEKWMREAIREAQLALAEGEVPVGAVVVADGYVIGRGHNQTERLNDPTAHAEIIALGAAGATSGDWRLPQATLYVTLEPCPMCAGAMVLARIGELVYAVDDPSMGACGSTVDLCADARLGGRLALRHGLMADESRRLMQEFFKAVRTGLLRRGAGAVERGGLENR